jgi:GntR family transcriptional regulator / MocR family aminotransferase
MKRAPEGLGPIVSLDRRHGLPLHRQLYDGYRAAILDGRLRAGQRLPSTRTLASELRVSRMPVVLAFEQLVAEGYIESRVGAGSFVARTFAAAAPATAAHRRRPRVPRAVLAEDDVAQPWLESAAPFRIALPALSEFPVDVWARLVARRARLLSSRQMMYGDSQGYAPLREVIAEHLRTVRSVRCTADQILITSGSQQALAVTARALLALGDAVWVEEPGFIGARDALVLAGAHVVPVRVDEAGIDVAAGIALCPRARAAYVTPSHQYPLGTIMTAPRRLQLLAWARQRGAWLIEDDYDSEYRYDSPPIAALQGLDPDDRVVYIGTFSKVLFPALRLGYVVLPRDLIARVRRIREAMDNSPAPFFQAVLHDFIREGHYARHLRRMRVVYGERRRTLVGALERELGDTVRIAGDRAGLHVVVLLPPGTRDRDVALAAAERGLAVTPLSSCYATRAGAHRPGLLVGYGVTSTRELPDAVRRLAHVLAQSARRR